MPGALPDAPAFDPREIAPGLWRWTAPHPEWSSDAAPGSSSDWPREVGCVCLQTARSAVFIDPLAAPDQAAFWRWADARSRGREVRVLTTVIYHRRSRDAFVKRYDAKTSRSRSALGDSVRAFPIRGARETMFWLPDQRALVPGDCIIGAPGGGLRVCPDSWLQHLRNGVMGPELRARLRPLLSLPVGLVLISHGEPVLRGAADALAHALS
jgi:hypothetical protein